MTRKQIEQLPYGSPEQINASDKWYMENVEHITEDEWEDLHNQDVWYTARQRWMAKELENEIR